MKKIWMPSRSPRIKALYEVTHPPSQPRYEDFPSPGGGEFRLHYDNPVEYATGAYSWDVTLLRGRTRIRRWSGAGEPSTLQPWAVTGALFAFPLCSSRGCDVYYGTIDGGDANRPLWPASAWLFSVQWAPTRSRLLLLGKSSALLGDECGHVAGETGWEPHEFGTPLAGWLPSSDTFFVFTQDGCFRFHTAEDATFISKERVDPANTFIFDQDRYAGVDRDRYALNIDGRAGVGDLMFMWSSPFYDSDSATVYLSTYRPAGDDGHGLIPVERKWVAVKLA
jgi:hypothetical protein